MTDLKIITDSEKATKAIRDFVQEQIKELDNEDTAETWEDVKAYRLTKKKLQKIFNAFNVVESKPKIPNQYR